MSRRLPLVVAVAFTAVVAACGSDGSTPRGATRRSTTSSSSPSTSSTTTVAPDPRGARFVLTPVAAVDTPTAMAVRTGDDTLYVTEQAGRVRAIRNGALDPNAVIDLRDTIASGGERGLLGLAFSPDGTSLYVDYTNKNGDTRVDAYPMRADGTADRGGRRELLAIAQPQANHNGGNLVTGPDGMLWIGTGDGGGAGDQGPGHAPEGNGQSLDTLLGKLLRIDPTPSGPQPYTIPPDNPFASGGGRPEIYDFGLRNPWKFSFDAADHALVIGDVGQNAYEEIDWVAAGTRPPLNFGWPRREGTHKYRSDDASGTVGPILDYPHDTRCSISGGYVYRGTKIPKLVGTYLYSDYCDGKIRGTLVGAQVHAEEIDFGIEAPNVSGFGQDHQNELYVLSQGKGLLRIDPA
ncbi:MAG: PQQ-dependent sugar dehydrogenase [Acidimicrobiia bacterium]